MFYEVYLDSLYLINLCLNIYLLEIVNYTLHRTATQGRIIVGSLGGTIFSLIAFMIPGNAVLKLIISFLLSIGFMIIFTFRVHDFKTIFRIFEKFIIYSFLLGGILLFIIRIVPNGRIYLMNVIGILLIGGLSYGLISYYINHGSKTNTMCKVTLNGIHSKLKINALIDTGNGLIEPISGKPVAVIEKSIFEILFSEEKPSGFRIIPYHSIGKKNGMLQGYLLPEIEIEIDGITKVLNNIYIGVSSDMISKENNYKMILNPQMLEG